MIARDLPRTFTRALLSTFVALGLVAALATSQAAEVSTWRIDDSGQTRDFILVDDEVYIEQADLSDEALAAEVRAALPGAVIVGGRNRGAHVKLPTALARQQSVARAGVVEKKLPGARVAPVLYVKGAMPDGATRRMASNAVLVTVEAGQDVAGLRAAVGAVSSTTTLLEGHHRFLFADAYRALDGAAALRRLGIKAEPQLRQQMGVRDIPNDPLFPNQWHLRNLGQAGGVPGADIRVPLAWDITTGLKSNGQPVNIAVVDDGIELTHPDLAANTFALNTGFNFDFNDDDNDPSPELFDLHGTPVAGLLGAVGGNLLGGAGVARSAKLAGLRLLGAPFTDSEAAGALTWNPPGLIVDVSNNSWGPAEGSGLVGPGALTRTALQQAAQTRRSGRGQITVFAAGNGAALGDDSNFDGFANSRFVIAVASVTNGDVASSFSETGANILVSAPDMGGALALTTTDLTGTDGYNGIPGNLDYTDNFGANAGGTIGGTSGSTALVSGVAGLMVAANPNLGWRDVHEILTSTARKVQPLDAGWDTDPAQAGAQNNEAGFKFHHSYGGGVVDAAAAVIRSLDWTNLAAETTQSLAVNPATPAPIPDDPMGGINLSVPFNFTGANLRVERAVVQVRITHPARGELLITLVSPDGTESVLAPYRPVIPATDTDTNYPDGISAGTWEFSTTHHWGENSQGTWRLIITDSEQDSQAAGTLASASVTLVGTASTSRQRFTIAEQEQAVPETTPSVTVNVQRLGGTTGAASVQYFISNRSTATAAQDYTNVSGTLNFGAGVATLPITIPLLDDTLPEVAEEIYLLLRSPTGASLGGVTVAKIRILDDEANVVTVVASDPTAQESSLAQTPNPGEFTIMRNAPENFDLPVTYAISGTAADGVDYFSLAGGTTIPAGETFVKVPVNIIDDLIGEGSETVTLTLVDTPFYDIGVPDNATVTIVDNEVPRVEVFVNPAAVNETSTGPVTFTVSRETTGPQVVSVNLLAYGSAAAPVNFIPPIPAQVTIPANEVSTSFTVVPVNNNTYQATTTLFVQVLPGMDYIEGFSNRVRLSFLEDDPLPDPKAPTTRIDQPAKDARIAAPGPVLAAGVANDNGLVTQVLYRVSNNAGDGPWRLATGTAVWQADITADCQPGPNVLSVYSIDDFANQSPIVTRSFTFVQARMLTVNVVGSGSVTAGFSPTSQRDAGVTYTITAKAQPGSIFNGWTGDIVAPGRELTFVMPNVDTTITANFITSPFAAANPPIDGRYVGLFREMTFALASSGFIDLTVGRDGAFSGFLLQGQKKHPFTGEFNGSGRFVGTISRKGDTPIAADLTLDVVPGMTDRVTGTLNGGTFLAAVAADRAVYNKTTNPYPAAAAAKQVFTFLLPAGAGLGPTQPHGHGYATMNVNSGGIVKWKGKLGDGSGVEQTVPLSKANTFPLFAAPYKAGGAIQGAVAIDLLQMTTDVAGVLDWGKAANNRDVNFPAGFVVNGAALEGSLYAAPAAGTRVLPGLALGLNNANSTLEDGRLTAAINKVLTWDEQNKISVVTAGPDALKLTIDPKTGLMTGSFFHPVAQKKTDLNGVAVQKQNRVGGQFRGTLFGGTNPQFGRLLVTPAP